MEAEEAAKEMVDIRHETKKLASSKQSVKLKEIGVVFIVNEIYMTQIPSRRNKTANYKKNEIGAMKNCGREKMAKEAEYNIYA